MVDEDVCGPRLPQALFDGFKASGVLQVRRVSFEGYGFDGHTGRDENVGKRGSTDKEESTSAQTGTPPSPFGVGLIARVYEQKIPTATRKQVAPVLKQVLEG